MSARRRILPLFIPHLGCPNDCLFCNQRRISGTLSPVGASDVVKAINHATAAIGPGPYELAFFGGSFTAIPTHEQDELLGAALPFLRAGTISSVRVSTRPDAISTDILDRLKRSGVGTIELGAQSMSDVVLKRCNRGHTAQDTINASMFVKSYGFDLILQMMTGLPGDDDAVAVKTARLLSALDPDGVRIYPTVVLRDTALYDLWNQGKYIEHKIEDAVRICAEIVPIFMEKNIPVIRLGLNPSEKLSACDAAAGAYHPALGELVISRVMLNNARQVLKDISPGETVTLGVPAEKVSAMIGQHRSNINTLIAEFRLKTLKVRAATCEKDKILILDIAKV